MTASKTEARSPAPTPQPADISVAVIYAGDRVEKMSVPLHESGLQVRVEPPDPYSHDIVIADNADRDLGKETLKRPLHDAAVIYRMRGDVFRELELWDMHPIKDWAARKLVLPNVDGAIAVTDRLAAKFRRRTNVSPVGTASLWIRPEEWPTVDHETTALRCCTLTNTNYWRKIRPIVDWAPVVEEVLADVGGHWHVCGDGKHDDRLQAALSEYEHVHFVGYVDARDKLAASNLLLHPSELDGCPNSILEGLASGLPVATNDWPEFIEHDWPVSTLTQPHHLQAQLRAFSNPDVRQQWATAGREYVDEHHRPEHIAGQYERFARRVVADG